MMLPIRTPQCNAMLGAPVDWDDEKGGECVALPIYRDVVNHSMHSFWQPNEQEIADILAGVPIRLTIIGTVHPPVSINVTSGIDA